MNRRTRFIAGLVTSLVMVFSLAEATWAATCGPVMGAGATAVAAAEEMPATDDRPTGHPDHREDGDRRCCPFGPAGASQGCSVAASLPADVTVDLTASSEATNAVLGAETGPELLIASALFHPPRS